MSSLINSSVFYGLGQHCRIEFVYDVYVRMLRLFRNSEGLIDTLNFISDTGFRKSYYGNGVYVLKLSGNESITMNQVRKITYTSYRGGVRAIGLGIMGSHSLLTIRIIDGTELIFYV
jgi:hypothetical protein